jgi:hypothetical protein
MMALINNWRNLFVAWLTQAITSRPLLLAATVMRTQHTDQTTLTTSSTHGMQHKGREAFRCPIVQRGGVVSFV